jgi:hypothetical protein
MDALSLIYGIWSVASLVALAFAPWSLWRHRQDTAAALASAMSGVICATFAGFIGGLAVVYLWQLDVVSGIDPQSAFTRQAHFCVAVFASCLVGRWFARTAGQTTFLDSFFEDVAEALRR